ncbi:hypothetical protein [Bdellovibrio bacteriovorus]|uniref:hypothetical protein n=1 Tax=Bdellovibrio bacteriovorus TaxID=959 RepID=UPI0011D1B137|nr:hypothetical protein [Bdellovibrio bacteriovorus]
MKYIFVLGLLLMSGLPAQAATVCNYTETPCDEQGNHYYCSMGRGWAGDRHFCSANDVSTPRPRQFIKARDYLRDCIKECVDAGGAASTCHHQCW